MKSFENRSDKIPYSRKERAHSLQYSKVFFRGPVRFAFSGHRYLDFGLRTTLALLHRNRPRSLLYRTDRCFLSVGRSLRLDLYDGPSATAHPGIGSRGSGRRSGGNIAFARVASGVSRRRDIRSDDHTLSAVLDHYFGIRAARKQEKGYENRKERYSGGHTRRFRGTHHATLRESGT